MSKSRGNVINPDEVVNKFGADTLRLYEMFMGPFDQMVAWSWESVEGVYRFIKRVHSLSLSASLSLSESSQEARGRLGRLAKRVESDIEGLKHNTAVAALMEWVNWWADHKSEVGKDGVVEFAKIIAPMAPFLAEEVYQGLRDQGSDISFESVHQQSWPVSDAGGWEEEMVTIVIQVNGKVRGKVEVQRSKDAGEQSIEKEALKLENVAKFMDGKKYKTVFVPGKVINFVVDAG
jgi:leucyl-tRNA synthetase